MRKAILNRGVSVVVLPGDVALRMAPEDATLTGIPRRCRWCSRR